MTVTDVGGVVMLGELDEELELELELLSSEPPPQAASPRASSRAAAQAERLGRRAFPGRFGRRGVATGL